MIPPVGSIVVGPCPQCRELVAVFCGQVLPLDRHVMEHGALEDRQDHLATVLCDFICDRVDALLVDAEAIKEGDLPDLISNRELDKFREIDLKLLDIPGYFESVFDA